MTFTQRLLLRQAEIRSLVCVGLDPDPDKLPKGRTGEILGRGTTATRLFHFACRIVEATAPFACCFKPNCAFWAAHGAEHELGILIHRIQQRHRCLVILDAKRGDIGTTAKFYAIEAFERYGADAVTVNMYLGSDTLGPWLAPQHNDRAIFVLCHTTNPGAPELQERSLAPEGRMVFEDVARLAVASERRDSAQVGLVMGATFPEHIEALRRFVPSNHPLLIPGIGRQGGDLAATVKVAAGWPFVINSSSGVIHASSGPDFADAAAAATQTLRDQINAALPTPVEA